MRISIRNATLEDAKAISSIGVASWQIAYRGIIPDEYLDSLSVERREKYTAKSLGTSTNRYIIAEADGQAVGMACFYPSYSEEAKDEWELEAIYLLPNYWGMGIGRELIQYALRYMKEHKARVCKLWVLLDNHRARKFYEHMRLTYSGVEKVIKIGGKDLIEVCYSICFQ